MPQGHGLLLKRRNGEIQTRDIYVVVQFYPRFKFYFPLFWGMVTYVKEFETKENKIWTKDKIEPPHIYPTKRASPVSDTSIKQTVARTITWVIQTTEDDHLSHSNIWSIVKSAVGYFKDYISILGQESRSNGEFMLWFNFRQVQFLMST